MRKRTRMNAGWQLVGYEGENLQIEKCKGGYFSTDEDFALKVVGKTEQNGTPSPDNPVDIEYVPKGTQVVACGKNLLSLIKSKSQNNRCESVITENSIKIVSNSITDTYSRVVIPSLPVYNLGNKQISISAQNISCSSADLIVDCILYMYASEGLKSTRTLTPSQLTSRCVVPKETTRLQFIFAMKGDILPGDIAEITGLQIEFGNVATPHTPYIGNEITVPCDLYEGDIWYPSLGKVIRNTFVYMFKSTYTYAPYNYKNSKGVYTKTHELPEKCVRQKGKCTHSTSVGDANRLLPEYVPIWFGVNNNGISYWVGILDKLGMTTISDFVSWLKSQEELGTPVKCVAELPEPIIEQYAPQPIPIYTGTTNIVQVSDDLNANLSVTHLVRR